MVDPPFKLPLKYQGAPYSLLGELILADASIDHETPQIFHTRSSVDSHRSTDSHRSPSDLAAPVVSSNQSTPLHSRHPSRISLDGEKDMIFSASLDLPRSNSGVVGVRPHSPRHVRDSSANKISARNSHEDMDTSLILRHSDDDELEHDPSMPYRPQSPRSPVTPGQGEKGTADKAGVILGIHNIFLVLPQFIVTTFSSLIFYLMEADKSLPEHHPQSTPHGGNVTMEVMGDMVRLVRREAVEGRVQAPDAVGLIFRCAGDGRSLCGTDDDQQNRGCECSCGWIHMLAIITTMGSRRGCVVIVSSA